MCYSSLFLRTFHHPCLNVTDLDIALGLTLLRLHIIAAIFREWLLALSQYGEIATVGFQALCHYTCNDIQIIRVLLSSGQPLR